MARINTINTFIVLKHRNEGNLSQINIEIVKKRRETWFGWTRHERWEKIYVEIPNNGHDEELLLALKTPQPGKFFAGYGDGGI